MSKVEELQSMTHEDLVRRVQELEEENAKLTKEKGDAWGAFVGLQEKFHALRDAVKNIGALAAD